MSEDVEYAGFWSRWLATLIDFILIIVVTSSALWLIEGDGVFDRNAEPTLFRVILEWIAPPIMVLAFWIKKSATPGKMLMKIKIVDAKTFEQVSIPKLFLRYFAYAVSMLPLGLGFYWAAWNKKKQGFHDIIAGTVTIKTTKAQYSGIAKSDVENVNERVDESHNASEKQNV